MFTYFRRSKRTQTGLNFKIQIFYLNVSRSKFILSNMLTFNNTIFILKIRLEDISQEPTLSSNKTLEKYDYAIQRNKINAKPTFATTFG